MAFPGVTNPQILEAFYSYGNFVEAIVWFGCCIRFGMLGYKGIQEFRWTSRLLSLFFLIFGISDLTEIHTRAWWKPWWLLLWKGSCVVAFCCLFWKYFHLKGDYSDRSRIK